MPRRDKSKYTDKQERKADHIAEGYEKRGAPTAEAERRAWATVNKDDHGGKAPGGSGRGQSSSHQAGVEAAKSVGRPLPVGWAQRAQPRPRRPLRRVDAMPNIEPPGIEP